MQSLFIVSIALFKVFILFFSWYPSNLKVLINALSFLISSNISLIDNKCIYVLKLAMCASLILFSIVTFLNLKNIIFFIFYENSIISSNIYHESDREYYQQLSRAYYYNNRGCLLEHQRKKYNSLSREEKDKRAIYAKNWYNSLPEDIKNIKRAYVRNKYHNMCNDEMLKHKEYLREYQKKLSRNEKDTRKIS